MTDLDQSGGNAQNPAGHGNEIDRRGLFRLLLPREGGVYSGRLEIDREKCTLCGLCTDNCLTEAIKRESDGMLKIIFRQELCDACGSCVESCPEECLKLERLVAVDRKQVAPIALVEGGLAQCPICGSVIGPEAMVKHIRSKLTGSNTALTDDVGICPACKDRQAIQGLNAMLLVPVAKE